MSQSNRKKGCSNVATAPLKRNPALDELNDTVDELVDRAAERMSTEELREATRKLKALDRPTSSARKQRRETA